MRWNACKAESVKYNIQLGMQYIFLSPLQKSHFSSMILDDDMFYPTSTLATVMWYTCVGSKNTHL